MKQPTSFFKTFILPLIFLYSITNNINAATFTFTNGGGDNLWSNAANWGAATIPSSGDDVILSSGSLIVDVAINVSSLSISNGATATFTHTGTAYIGDLAMGSGSLDSQNKIVVTNGFNWTNTSSITTSSSLELSATSTNAISGSGNRNLYGLLVNNGSCTHTGGSLRFQTGGSFENNGIYTLDGADFIISVGGDGFTNKGTFNKNGLVDLNLFSFFDQSGTGTLNVNAGTLKLLSGGTHTGNSVINIANDAILNIGSGLYSFGSDSNISGDGNIDHSGGTTTFGCSYGVNGETKISGGTVDFNNADPALLSKLTLSGGTLQGSGQLVISDQLNWTGSSTIQNTDTIKLASTANGLIYSGGSKNLYTPLINEGSISHTGGNLRFYPGGSIHNNGTYTVNGPTKIFDNGGNSFENNGTFDFQKKSVFKFYPDFNNNINGKVKSKGNIEFSNLTNLGAFLADAAYGTFEISGDFDNGNALNIGFDGASHGDIKVSGDVSLSGALDVQVTGTVPVGTYTILSTTSGIITGTFDDENISSSFNIQYTSTEVKLTVGLLPVEFIAFDVLAQGNDALLKWQTASELNSASFIIEHSPDGQNFVAVGTVKAAGNSNTTKDYRFLHDAPYNGLNYYRLRQVDIDGSIDYSDLKVLNHYNFNKDLTIYPNPSQGVVTIKNRSEKTFKIIIRNLSGEIMLVRNGFAPGAMTLDLQDFPKSMYTLEISDDGFYLHQEKLMILE